MSKLQLTIIGGLPVSGKTTIMNRIRKKLVGCTQGRYGTLRYEEYDKHIIFGIYAGKMFDGTDKLSMAVMKDSLEFLSHNTKKVLIEGDRLFTAKFIQGAITLGYTVDIYICIVDQLPEIVKRYQKRGKMQNPKFLKGRHTKIVNIMMNFPHTIINTNETVPDKIIDNLIT